MPEWTKMAGDVLGVSGVFEAIRRCKVELHEVRSKEKALTRKLRKLKKLYETTHLETRLKANPPKSDRWFQEIWDRDMKIPSDLYNSYLGPYIPDCYNPIHRYVIELDGAWHNQYFQKKKDERKDQYYRDRDYVVFYIKAYDVSNLEYVFNAVLTRRKQHLPPVSPPPFQQKVVRRRKDEIGWVEIRRLTK